MAVRRGPHVMLANVLAILFWSSALLLVFTFAGYHLLISRLRRQSAVSDCTYRASVSVVVVAHNEADRIETRLRNLLASEYPAGLLRIVLVADGCTDGTADIARQLGDERLSVIDIRDRKGKPHGLNRAIAESSSELIVFADARQAFASNTIAVLAARFADPSIGAVSGDLQIQGAGTGVGRAVDSYWKWEKKIRKVESDLDSCIGCTGAVYAIRRACFRPIPDDTILDDVVIPMQIALQGYRIIHEQAAVAFDPQTLEPHREKLRKKRTLAGNFQMLCRYPGWLLPWKNRLWWQLLSHKYLRLASPGLLTVTLLCSIALADHPLFLTAALAQGLFYALAAIGLAFPRLQLRILSLPAGFVFLNARIAAALMYYLQTRGVQGWATPRY